MVRRFAGVVLLTAMVAIAAAQENSPATGEQRRLVEQKLRLVEMLVNSPAAKRAADGREADAAQLVEKGRQLLEQARQALAAGQFGQAGGALDEALRNATKAAARLSAEGAGLSDSAQLVTLRDLASQVATYRAAVEEQVRSGKAGGDAKALLAQIDLQTNEARGLEAAGRLGEANRKLAEAYKAVVEGLSRLRAGQTVTMSLKFDTPADEYAYEQKRFASNEILVDMTIGDGRAEGERRKPVDTHVGEGRRLRSEAETLAKNGDYKAAVTTMEQASGQLNRALQLMGIPVY